MEAEQKINAKGVEYAERDWESAEDMIAGCINEIAKQANVLIDPQQRMQMQIMASGLWSGLANVRLVRLQMEQREATTRLVSR